MVTLVFLMLRHRVRFLVHDYGYGYGYVNAHGHGHDVIPSMNRNAGFRSTALVSVISACWRNMTTVGSGNASASARANGNGRGHGGYGSWLKLAEHRKKPYSGYQLLLSSVEARGVISPPHALLQDGSGVRAGASVLSDIYQCFHCDDATAKGGDKKRTRREGVVVEGVRVTGRKVEVYNRGRRTVRYNALLRYGSLRDPPPWE